MRRYHLASWMIMSIATFVGLHTTANAQPAKIPFHREAYFVHSGLHDGQVGPEAKTNKAFNEVIWVPGIPWLRLRFQAYHLSKQESIAVSPNDSAFVENDSIRSYITITSLEDGGQQRLDGISLKQWRHTSAYFNGDAVEIELYVAPGDKGIFFEVEEILVGDPLPNAKESLGKTGGTEAVCGGTDDRIPSDDPAVGRVLAISGVDMIAQCTGWIAANGAHLTAGHCVSVLDVLEFNVPSSDSLGNPQFAHPDDQYAVVTNPDSIKSEDAGWGDDWAVFTVYPNSNTGLLPVQAQGAFYRVSYDHDPDTIRVTGFGVDGPAPCFGDWRQYGCNTYNPPRDSTSQTQQTSADVSHGEQGSGSSVYWDYETDVQGGNSGSPLIAEGTTVSVGICTHHPGIYPRTPCPGQDYNKGTSFESDDLADSLNFFPGNNIEYADKDHPVVSEDGTVFRPYDTVNEAVTAVSSGGGIVSIVKGYYNETITISKAMTITAPVGVVTIGASGLGKLLAETPAAATSSKPDSATTLLPTVYSLSPGYPNPFNPVTTIRFGLPEAARTRLVVYDLLGREVAPLVDGHLEAAYHAVVWNGKDAAGRAVPSGIYIYRLVASSTESGRRFSTSRKMVLMR